MGLILVLNIHGVINSPSGTRRAMSELKVSKKFTASVVADDETTVGMLKLCKDYVAWTAIDQGLLRDLLRARGAVSSTRTLDEAALKKLGFKSHDEMASKIVSEGRRLSSVEGVRPFFNLSPPRGGFKRSVRRQYSQGGILGDNPKLEEMVRRMM